MEEGDRLYSSVSWTCTKCATSWRLNEKTARLHEELCVICSKKGDGPVRKSHIIQQNCDEEFHGLRIYEQQCHMKGQCVHVLYTDSVQNIFSMK